MNKLSSQLVTWNGAKYLPYLFESLRRQSFQDFTLQIIDNGSTDNTVMVLRDELSRCAFTHNLEILQENIGFAKAHNQLVQTTNAEYVLLLNQDMFLLPEYITRVLATFHAHPDVGAAIGRVMRWDFHLLSDRGHDALQHSFTQYIDTLGLKVFRSRRVVDWLTGARWPDVNRQVLPDGGVEREVFGVSGCLPMYKRRAIMQVMLDGQMFDEEYFSYKEDVDLAWRLQIAGWKSLLVTDAIAYHDRSAAGPLETTDKAAVANRKSMSKMARYHSYKNHLFTIIKNEYASNYLKDFLWIELYEWKKFIYFFFFENATWRGFFTVLKKYPSMLCKRKKIIAMRQQSAKDLRKWWRK